MNNVLELLDYILSICTCLVHADTQIFNKDLIFHHNIKHINLHFPGRLTHINGHNSNEHR